MYSKFFIIDSWILITGRCLGKNCKIWNMRKTKLNQQFKNRSRGRRSWAQCCSNQWHDQIRRVDYNWKTKCFVGGHARQLAHFTIPPCTRGVRFVLDLRDVNFHHCVNALKCHKLVIWKKDARKWWTLFDCFYKNIKMSTKSINVNWRIFLHLTPRCKRLLINFSCRQNQG